MYKCVEDSAKEDSDTARHRHSFGTEEVKGGAVGRRQRPSRPGSAARQVSPPFPFAGSGGREQRKRFELTVTEIHI